MTASQHWDKPFIPVNKSSLLMCVW